MAFKEVIGLLIFSAYDDDYLFCLVYDHLQRIKKKERRCKRKWFVSSIICLRLTDEKGYYRKRETQDWEREVALKWFSYKLALIDSMHVYIPNWPFHENLE